MTEKEQQERKSLLKLYREALARGDKEEAARVMKLVPILPEEARAAKRAFGIEWLRTSGLNFSAAERAYGKDWFLQ